MQSSSQSDRARDEGQIIVLFALFAVVLVGFLALAVDVGYLYSERRAAQSAVDAAAMAGGVAMLAGETTGVIQDTGEAYLTANGIDLGASGVVTTITPEGAPNDGRVIVDIEMPVERFFLGAIYTGDWQVGAHAVAEIRDDRDGEYALIALDPAGMYVNGDVEITVIDGSAMSNGDVDNDGNSSIFISGGTIDAVGEVESNNNWRAPDGMFGNRPTMPDPVEGDPPDPNELPIIEEENLPDCGGNDDCVLQPGVYRDLGTITIKQTARLNPGIFYFEGTALALQNTNSRIEGTGVMLYFTGNPNQTFFDPKNGEVSLASENDPDTAYEGGVKRMTVWIANCSEFDSQGNNEFFIDGVFYAPCSRVWLHGNPNGETIHGQVIVGELDMRGTSELVVQYEGHVFTPRFELWLVE
jgi:hypothetical protein